MGNYDWDNCKMVGVENMDDQHQVLLGYIRELHHINECDVNGTKASIDDVSG